MATTQLIVDYFQKVITKLLKYYLIFYSVTVNISVGLNYLACFISSH